MILVQKPISNFAAKACVLDSDVRIYVKGVFIKIEVKEFFSNLFDICIQFFSLFIYTISV